MCPRALITGGAGFLGSHLCRYLMNTGLEVIAIDNLLTGDPNNIADLIGQDRFHFIDHDVTNYFYLEGPLDYILHFASPASPKDYRELPIQTLKVGSLGTHKTLGLAKGKQSTYLLASTSEVYGDPLTHPQPESYWGNVNPIGPRGVYDEAKRFAEAMTMAYHRAHGVDTRIARIFNTFGPGMRLDDGRAIPNFIRQALQNEPITVYGKGTQTRSFCYIDDMVDGLNRVLRSNLVEPVNIGNPQEMTILEMAELIRKLAGSTSELLFLPLDSACFLDLFGVGVLDDALGFLSGFLQVGLPLPASGARITNRPLTPSQISEVVIASVPIGSSMRRIVRARLLCQR